MAESYLLSASEMGSVKALLPICKALHQNNANYFIVRRGAFKKIQDEFNFIDLNDDNDIENFLKRESITRYIFSSNISDQLPLKIARIAESSSIKTIHVLDFWSLYIHRMSLDNKKPFCPDHYIVPDLNAQKHAIDDGINKSSIYPIGQPAFGDIEIINRTNEKMLPEFQERTIFILEPIKEDLKMRRGYNEVTVIKNIASVLLNKEDSKLKFDFLIHPRMNENFVNEILETFPKNNLGRIISSKVIPLEILSSYPAVCGMSSTLLYEAWLFGKKVFSIQPNLKMPWLNFYQDLEGIFYTEKDFDTNMLLALEDVSKALNISNPRYEIINKHKNAVKEILNI